MSSRAGLNHHSFNAIGIPFALFGIAAILRLQWCINRRLKMILKGYISCGKLRFVNNSLVDRFKGLRHVYQATETLRFFIFQAISPVQTLTH